MPKLSLEDIQGVEFKERHFKVMSRDQVSELDIVFDNSPMPAFENKFYCIKLIRLVLRLKRKERRGFLSYQIQLCKSPFHWVVNLDQLLENNWRLLMKLGYKDELNDWLKLLEDARNGLFPKALAKHQLPTNQVPIPIEEATPYWLKFTGKTNVIAGLFYQIQQHETESGERLCLNDYKEIAEHIHHCWRKADGSRFNLNSLLTILRPSRSDKRPKEGKGISLDTLMGGE